MPEPRRTFGPVVLLGLAAGALTAVAGQPAWVEPTSRTPPASAPPTPRPRGDAGEMPLAAALSLVVLACWGVLLVTRGRVRRVVAVLGRARPPSASWPRWSAGWSTSCPTRVARRSTRRPASRSTPTSPAWFWAAAVGAARCRRRDGPRRPLGARHWPEMGSRYDAPRRRAPSAEPPAGGPTSLDLWKAMDEGRDPTE